MICQVESVRTHETSSEDHIFSFRCTSVSRVDYPSPVLCIKLGSNDNSVESAVLLYADHFVDVIKVVTKVLIIGVIVWPIPSIVYLGPRELILGNFRVNASARVAVPSPSTSGIVACLENYRLHAPITQGLEHEDTGYIVSR